MKIQSLIIIEIEEEEEFIKENDFAEKDAILARYLTNPEEFLKDEGAYIEVSNVVWLEQPKDES